MKLPVVQHGEQSVVELAVRALNHADLLASRTSSDEQSLSAATAFSNVSRPNVHMTNLALDVREVDGMTAEQVIEEIIAHYSEKNLKCWYLMVNGMVWPKALASAAEDRGYQLTGRDVYLLSEYHQPRKLCEDLQVLPGRAAYQPLSKYFIEMAEAEYHDRELAEQLGARKIDWLDDPRVETFVGRIGGEIAGAVTLVSLGQMGVIYDVHTRADVRNQYVATTLLDHAIEMCKRAQFEMVVLDVVDGNDVGGFYERLGFRNIGRYELYFLAEMEKQS